MNLRYALSEDNVIKIFSQKKDRKAVGCQEK